MPDIWLFVTGLLVVYLVPGPDMLLVLDTVLYKGRFNALMIGLGLAASRTIHVVLSGTGLAALEESFPWVWELVHYAGGVFLIWMGAGLARTPVFNAKKRTTLVGIETKACSIRVLGKGFFTNLLNPKALLFCSVFLPQFVSGDRDTVWPQYFMLGVILVGMGFVFDLLFISIGTTLEKSFANVKVQLAQRWGVALIFIGIGLYFIFDGVGWYW